MKNLLELTRYIRFQLSQLKAQNGHHAFENMCRQFARLRICDRILPATGPVSAGGDQAKDFESFKTHLEQRQVPSPFLATVSNEKLVFACSLQERVQGKIKADVEAICSGQQRVNSIYFFIEQDFPVAKRHDLQDWARRSYDVHLEILDGQALAEALTDPEIFWIAEEFLGVSADQYPQPPESKSRYARVRKDWCETDASPRNYADFFEVKYGLRHATFTKEAKPDLGSWIRITERFLESDAPDQLRRKAIYEIAVAALRGQNNLDRYAAAVETYFQALPALEDGPDLTDATTLLSYCSTARYARDSERDPSQLHEWSGTLVRRLKDLLGKAVQPGRKCLLLQLLGTASRLPYLKGTEPRLEFDAMFRYWDLLTREVARAPLFPLEQFADVLTVLAPHVRDHPRFVKLTAAVDELLQARTGGYVAAEKCRDRAVAYMDAGQYLPAIKQLHSARVKWFSAETLKGSVLAMLTLGHCYSSLGLQYAAAYYSLGAALMAFRADSEGVKALFSKALFQSAEHYYRAGASITFLEMLIVGIFAHGAYEKDPGDLERHEAMQQAAAYTVVLRAIAIRFHPEIRERIDQVIDKWPIDTEFAKQIREESENDTLSYYTATEASLLEEVKSQFTDVPFSDLGSVRRIRWSVLGLKWTVSHRNEFDTTQIAEEFVATLQIIAADLAQFELGLLPTSVEIEVALNESNDFAIDEKPNNEKTLWEVSFPRRWLAHQDHAPDLRARIVAVATAVLHGCSVIRSEDFMRIVENAFKDGLSAKTFSVRPHAELYAEFISKDIFEGCDRGRVRPPWYDNELEFSVSDELAWRKSPGPGYTSAKSRRFIKNRYKNAISPIRFAIGKLLEHEVFRAFVRGLRHEGYRDWHILVLLTNLIGNDRIDKRVDRRGSMDILKKAMKEEMNRVERPDDEMPALEIFSHEKVAFQKQFTWLAIAKTWGLYPPRRTPDFRAFEKLLIERYRCFEDDILHDDPFPGCSVGIA